MRQVLVAICLAGLVGMAGGAASAQALTVPTSLTFVGRLADSGVPVTGTHTLIFKLFNASNTKVWEESHIGVTVDAGMVNFALGSGTPLDNTIFDGTSLQLEITVDVTVMSPRLAIRSVPYAVRAGVAGVAEKVPLAGSGTAVTAAHSDHTHTYYQVNTPTTCTVSGSSWSTAICTSGDVVLGGGCSTTSTVARILTNAPGAIDRWACYSNSCSSPDTMTASAICYHP